MKEWWIWLQPIQKILVGACAIQLVFFWLVLPVLIATCIDYKLTYSSSFFASFKSIYLGMQVLLVLAPSLLGIFLLLKGRWRWALCGILFTIIGFFSSLFNVAQQLDANKGGCSGFAQVGESVL